jgi:nucleoside-diphosphate-sugar epimerase
MERVIEKIVNFRIKKVIYTSSTSVYGFQKENITEKSKTSPMSNAAKKILMCEKKLLENHSFESCIVRLGGLIGPGRHPIYSLSGKQNLPNPKSPINLIHQIDAVGITLYLSENWNGNEIFNAVTQYHPTRKDYYMNISKIAKLAPPKFEKKGKIRGEISSSKLLKLTNYKFKVENLLILN